MVMCGLWTVINASLHYYNQDVKRRRHHRGGLHGIRQAQVFPPWYGLYIGYRSGSCYFPLEPILKIALPLGGCLCELTAAKFSLYSSKQDQTHRLHNVNNFAHCTMYMMFMASGAIDLIGYVSRLPQGTERAFMGLAFSVETFVFGFHLHGRDELDVRCHLLLCMALATCAIFTFLEFHNPSNVIHQITRAMFTVIQGTWFFQVSFILYGVKPWDPDEDEILELVSVVFFWHVSVSLLVVCLIFVMAWLVIVKFNVRPFCCVAVDGTVKLQVSNGSRSCQESLVLEMRELRDDAEEDGNET